MNQFLLSLKSFQAPISTSAASTSTAHKIWVALFPGAKSRTQTSVTESQIALVAAYAIALTTIDPELQ